MHLPVSYSKVLLLFQGVDKRDQEVFVIEKSGKESDPLLYVRPGCVGGLMTEGEKQLFLCRVSPELHYSPAAPSLICTTTSCLE